MTQPLLLQLKLDLLCYIHTYFRFQIIKGTTRVRQQKMSYLKKVARFVLQQKIKMMQYSQ